MKQEDRLHILWTNADVLTSDKMVLMYAINGKIHGFFEEITIIIWGATAKLVAENELIGDRIKQARHVGVHVSACKACADQLGVTSKLEALGIELKYWGEGLTEIIKKDSKLLTI